MHLFTSNNGCLHGRQSLPSGAVRTQAMDRVCGICLISSAASIGARHPQRKCFLRPLNAADRIPFQKFGLNLRGTCRRLKMDRGQCYCVTEVGCLSPVCNATSILSNGVCPATAATKQNGLSGQSYETLKPTVAYLQLHLQSSEDRQTTCI